MRVIDISRSLSAKLAPWPGDTPFAFDLKWKIADGASVNVGALTMSAHAGTHADATFHFDTNGLTMEQMPLDAYLGAAVVVDLSEKFAHGATGGIRVEDLAPHSADLERTGRLLLKTNRWCDSSVFPQWIPVVSAEVPPWLAGKNVRLLGLDLPSVDPLEAKQLANHHALAAAGIAIVEGLDLTRVEAGVYQLAALPVKIAGGDGAPVRAVLWRE